MCRWVVWSVKRLASQKLGRQQQDARRREQQGFDIAREVTRYGRQHSLYEPHGRNTLPGVSAV